MWFWELPIWAKPLYIYVCVCVWKRDPAETNHKVVCNCTCTHLTAFSFSQDPHSAVEDVPNNKVGHQPETPACRQAPEAFSNDCVVFPYEL